VTIGVDLGQRADYTAIAVLEGWREQLPGLSRPQSRFLVRQLGRLELGTNYLAVARRVREVVARARPRAAGALTVYVDATGVGGPVLDVVRSVDLHAALMSVYFTSTDRLVPVHQERPKTAGVLGSSRGPVIELRMGKAYMVSRLQALLQGRRLEFAHDLPGAAAVRKEISDYEIRASDAGNDTFGAFSHGTHDDVVAAVGLASIREPPASSFASPAALTGREVRKFTRSAGVTICSIATGRCVGASPTGHLHCTLADTSAAVPALESQVADWRVPGGPDRLVTPAPR
jgi:hypothetical protein